MDTSIIRKIPTGYLFTSKGERGMLETLSIGDYGKSKNIKADFLGFTKEINGVPNCDCMPLSEKWVITLSTQYGCPQKCTFCFPSNTQISTPLGNKNIQDIIVGDHVVSFNEETTCFDVSEVSQIFANVHTNSLIEISLYDGSTLQLTENHPVLVEYEGSLQWIEGKHLEEGMTIIKHD